MKDRAKLAYEVLRDCLFRNEELVDGKPPEGYVLGPGIISNYAFSPDRIAAHREDIQLLISDLPESFYVDGGGGMSFLNLCVDAKGEQWGEYRDMDNVCVLAIASGCGRWCLPREMWKMFPGGMPYVSFDRPTIAKEDSTS